ncbi:hypothetical protein V8B97DRAFT_2007779 [Scleroderma yunnanense]
MIVIHSLKEPFIDLGSMYMINENAFIEWERAIKMGKQDGGINVVEFHDDEDTHYAILSHQWTGKEVDYKEMIKLTKMKESDQKAVRNCDGYKKILASCEQAKRRRSSAELSEAINSMYRWYASSKVCYAYLHDVTSTSLTKRSDYGMYPNSNGWPEWFSHWWTLQEMIAPSSVQFFNKDWHPISNKRALAQTLSRITRVPEHILRDGLSSNRPCIAQIMSWAAKRKTTRVEDRAYSLLGLLNVNMPMLYGEGKKAFHCLQLEIIRTSNDQSIFAWKGADWQFFEDCNLMELMDPSEFVQDLKKYTSIDEDHFGTFLITNRGIQIWMLLRPLGDSDSVFEAWLPCRSPPSDLPVGVRLALWNSNYYRYHAPERANWKTLQLRQISRHPS